MEALGRQHRISSRIPGQTGLRLVQRRVEATPDVDSAAVD